MMESVPKCCCLVEVLACSIITLDPKTLNPKTGAESTCVHNISNLRHNKFNGSLLVSPDGTLFSSTLNTL